MAFSSYERSFPHQGGPGQYVSESDWSAMASAWQDNGVHGTPAGNALKIVPGDTINTIKVLPGTASINGFYYTLTAEKVVEVPVNTDPSQNRKDLVVLTLNVEGDDMDIQHLTGTTTALPEWDDSVSIPLGEWHQRPQSLATGSNWGSAYDRRWFAGVRVRPFLNVPGFIPPAKVGALAYSETDQLFIGKLVGGEPTWVEYFPGSRVRFALKTANQSITNSTTLTNDNELFVNVDANSAYAVDAYIIYQTTDNADFNVGFSLPSGATFTWTPFGSDPAVNGNSSTAMRFLTGQATYRTLGGGGGEVMAGTPRGTLITGANSGVVRFRFSQNSAQAVTTTVWAGSWLRLEKIY